MTQAERSYNSATKEVEKYQTRLQRLSERMEKKNAQCQKLGCDWTNEEYRARQTALRARHEGEAIIPLGNDDDLLSEKQNCAWFDRECLKSEIEDAQYRLNDAIKSLDKATLIYKGVQIEIAEQEAIDLKEQSWMTGIKLSKEQIKANAEKAKREYEKWLAQFKAECLKDGVIIDEADSRWISGTTKSGKKFQMYINEWGYTERSFHCYTLRINGETIFTSGLFSTGYRVVKA